MDTEVNSIEKEKPECPERFTVDFGRKLIAYLGGDASIIKDSWCWKDFAKHFSHLREKAEKYFEEAQEGDPSWAAYNMHVYCGSSKEWTEKVIENAKTGDPAWCAYLMRKYYGSSKEWLDKVINNAKLNKE